MALRLVVGFNNLFLYHIKGGSAKSLVIRWLRMLRPSVRQSPAWRMPLRSEFQRSLRRRVDGSSVLRSQPVPADPCRLRLV
jgi:hypothetical protein